MATLLLFAAVELVWLYPQLPDRVVTHFGLDGVGGHTATRASVTCPRNAACTGG